MRSMRAALAMVALFGCADGGMERCRVGADCASGVCRSDGRCEPAPRDGGETGPDGGDAPRLDAGEAHDAGVPLDGAVPGDDGGARVCSADRDGTITRAEVPMRAGLHATFRVAEDAAISTAGTMEGSARRWDLEAALEGDTDVRRELRPLGTEWYADSFPGAGWTLRLSEREELLDVFEITDEALLLRGVVSPEDGFTRTELTYDPAVVVLRFPMREGDSWETTSTVSGVALGVASYYTETYTSTVDARGELVAPFGTFDVLRVRTVLDRLVGAYPTRIRSYAFVSECFGTVATIASRAGETQVEFTQAAEVSRLAP